VRYARCAEEVGFSFALISDHFHPWLDRHGQSPFVWSVIGGIA
jgi:alkanesulfonate monooxygenase SsuD/methylene tetrahydromethanopterin reductase-like flavin-dependent oxidoreductase (luciferase family)